MKKNTLIIAFLLCCVMAFAKGSENKLFDGKYIRSELLKVSEWQLKHPKHDPLDWTNAAFYRGLFAAWKRTNSKDLLTALKEMGEKSDWQPFKRWYFADDIAVCRTYLDLYERWKDRRMIAATIDTMNKFVKDPYPGRNNPQTPIKLWWCDALFMAPPVLVKLAKATGDEEYLKYNDQYYKECYDLLYDKKEHLFFRDLSYTFKADGSGKREANGRPVFWSRGNGWVLGGLAMVLEDLPKNYEKRTFYEGLFKEMSQRIASLQQSDGLWRASLLDPESYPGGEVSGSGFLCYALAWGIHHKLLDRETYLPVVEKAWKGLNTCVNEEGRVGWVQPIGGDPQKNFSENSWEVYGTGAFLLAGSEVIELNIK